MKRPLIRAVALVLAGSMLADPSLEGAASVLDGAPPPMTCRFLTQALSQPLANFRHSPDDASVKSSQLAKPYVAETELGRRTLGRRLAACYLAAGAIAAAGFRAQVDWLPWVAWVCFPALVLLFEMTVAGRDRRWDRILALTLVSAALGMLMLPFTDQGPRSALGAWIAGWAGIGLLRVAPPHLTEPEEAPKVPKTPRAPLSPLRRALQTGIVAGLLTVGFQWAWSAGARHLGLDVSGNTGEIPAAFTERLWALLGYAIVQPAAEALWWFVLAYNLVNRLIWRGLGWSEDESSPRRRWSVALAANIIQAWATGELYFALGRATSTEVPMVWAGSFLAGLAYERSGFLAAVVGFGLSNLLLLLDGWGLADLAKSSAVTLAAFLLIAWRPRRSPVRQWAAA